MYELAEAWNTREAIGNTFLIAASVACIGNALCLVSVFARDWFREDFNREKNDN